MAAPLVQRDDAFAGFKLWYYTPSIPAAVIFTIIFICLTAYHTLLLVRRRTWFCIPFVIGGLFEIIGYIARALAHGNTSSVSIYSAQSLMLLLAPILFAASVYMILGRIIRLVHGDGYSMIRPNWLTKIFVGGDVFCFMLQGAGGGLLAVAKTKDEVDRGNNVILGGLILQILIFLFFLTVAFVFQLRMHRQPTHAALDGPLGENAGVSNGRFGRLTWKKLMLGLYVTSILITVRNLFRVIEYGMGWGSYLLSTEWPLYMFDALLMSLVLVICIMWYNPEIAKGNKKYATVVAESHNLGHNDIDASEPRVIQTTKHESNKIRPWS